MFKLVCKTPLFTKEKQHCKLNQLYCRTFYSCQSFLGQPRFAMFCSTTFRHVNSKQIWLPNTLGMLVEDDAVLTGKKTIIFYHKCRKQRKKEKNIKNKRFPSKKSKPAGGFSKAQNRESSAEITSFGVVCHQHNIYRFFMHHKTIQILRYKIHCHCVKLILVDMLLYY